MSTDLRPGDRVTLAQPAVGHDRIGGRLVSGGVLVVLLGVGSVGIYRQTGPDAGAFLCLLVTLAVILFFVFLPLMLRDPDRETEGPATLVGADATVWLGNRLNAIKTDAEGLRLAIVPGRRGDGGLTLVLADAAAEPGWSRLKKWLGFAAGPAERFEVLGRVGLEETWDLAGRMARVREMLPAARPPAVQQGVWERLAGSLHCPRCGYMSATGRSTDACPECGEAMPRDGVVLFGWTSRQGQPECVSRAGVSQLESLRETYAMRLESLEAQWANAKGQTGPVSTTEKPTLKVA